MNGRCKHAIDCTWNFLERWGLLAAGRAPPLLPREEGNHVRDMWATEETQRKHICHVRDFLHLSVSFPQICCWYYDFFGEPTTMAGDPSLTLPLPRLPPGRHPKMTAHQEVGRTSDPRDDPPSYSRRRPQPSACFDRKSFAAYHPKKNGEYRQQCVLSSINTETTKSARECMYI